jgi:alpha-glucosidase
MGAMTWTGDIAPTWDDLGSTPGVMLNWGLAGNPIVTCDTGGFSGETNALLLSRWYQVAAFMPVMRVHSTKDAVPHWPFVWGAEAGESMKLSLELRYRMVPTHYAIAHEMTATGVPAMRTMLMEYPDDPVVAEMTTEWMFGDSILVAPVMAEDNATSPYLPAGTWYEFNNSAAGNQHLGPTTISLKSVSLNSIPVYVKAGGMVALAPLVQYTDALPGNGVLELQIYGGADGTFTLVEDDGETTGYMAGTDTVRSTSFSWDDAKKTLSWKVTGTYATKVFMQVDAVLFTSGAAKKAGSSPTVLGTSGTVTFM